MRFLCSYSRVTGSQHRPDHRTKEPSPPPRHFRHSIEGLFTVPPSTQTYRLEKRDKTIKENTSPCLSAKLHREKHTKSQPYIKNYKQLSDSGTVER